MVNLFVVKVFPKFKALQKLETKREPIKPLPRGAVVIQGLPIN